MKDKPAPSSIPTPLLHFCLEPLIQKLIGLAPKTKLVALRVFISYMFSFTWTKVIRSQGKATLANSTEKRKKQKIYVNLAISSVQYKVLKEGTVY